MTPEPPPVQAAITPGGGSPETPAWLSSLVRLAGLVKDYAAPVAALGGLVGAVIYAVMWLLLLNVYRPLGVTPSEVGLDYGSVLVATAAVMIAIAALAIVLEGLALISSLIKNKGARAVFAVIAALALVALAKAGAGLNGPLWIVVPFFTFVIWIAGAGLPAVLSELGHRRAVGLGVLVAGALIVFMLLFRAAEDTAKLKDGERPNRLYLAPVPWDARIAQIAKATDAAAGAVPTPPKCVFLLGTANGTTALYDPSADPAQAILLPSGDVTIAVRPQAKHVSSC